MRLYFVLIIKGKSNASLLESILQLEKATACEIRFRHIVIDLTIQSRDFPNFNI